MNNGIYESGKSSMVCPSPIKAFAGMDKKQKASLIKKGIGRKAKKLLEQNQMDVDTLYVKMKSTGSSDDAKVDAMINRYMLSKEEAKKGGVCH
jgi:hypothetical protein